MNKYSRNAPKNLHSLLSEFWIFSHFRLIEKIEISMWGIRFCPKSGKNRKDILLPFFTQGRNLRWNTHILFIWADFFSSYFADTPNHWSKQQYFFPIYCITRTFSGSDRDEQFTSFVSKSWVTHAFGLFPCPLKTGNQRFLIF